LQYELLFILLYLILRTEYSTFSMHFISKNRCSQIWFLDQEIYSFGQCNLSHLFTIGLLVLDEINLSSFLLFSVLAFKHAFLFGNFVCSTFCHNFIRLYPIFAWLHHSKVLLACLGRLLGRIKKYQTEIIKFKTNCFTLALL
jgi:hypothetical protein